MKTRLDYIDLLRVFFCIAIFAYHIGFLKGGYLAVCSFFVLSGYLTAMSFKKEKFNILSYYKSRFLRVYLPMVLVIFATIGIMMVAFPDVIWISMKREVKSLLLGYNNFWQLDANLDYFARHVDSPFMHLWYVAILIQLEIIFPIIYLILEFLREKTAKCIPVIICYLAGTGSIIWFVYVHMTEGLMNAYYNTLTRCFAWFLGLGVGLYHSYKRPFVVKKMEGRLSARLMFFLLLIAQTVLFVLAAADSELYLYAMIATTFIACRLLEYANVINKDLPNGIKQFIGYLSGISYELFLVQYPVIYMFQFVKSSDEIRVLLIIAVTFAASSLIHFSLGKMNGKVPKLVIQFLLLYVLIMTASYGGCRYVAAPDKQAEQEKLEEELKLRAEEQQRKQKEYEEKRMAEAEERRKAEEERKKKEEELRQQLEAAKADIDKQIEILEQQKLELTESVKQLPITFVGDSVLLGASDTLYVDFPNCYIDAKVSRTAYVINAIFQDLLIRELLGDPVVINCGANGDCSEECKNEIMATLEGRQVFWLTSTNNTSANETLLAYAENYDNLHVIDWATISAGHPEYFVADGIHLQPAGRAAYSQAIYDAIYSYYVAGIDQQILDLQTQKENLNEENLEPDNAEQSE